MKNNLTIYTKKIYTTNEDIIDSNIDNTTNENVNNNYTDNVQNSSGNNKNCVIRFKNNHKVLFVLLIICSLVLLAGVGYLIYKLKNRNKCKNGNCEDGKGDGIYASNGEKLVAFIKREKHQCLIVNETISIISKHVDNENNSEENQEEPIYNKYLLNIYDEEKMNDKSIKYYAYVLLLKELEGDINDIIAGNNIFDTIETENSRKQKEELLQEYLNENQNINNEEEDLQIKYGRTLKELKLLNLSPLVKFSFFENGTVYEISKPKKIDNYLYANIENFIFKNIPSLSENLYTSKDSKRNLEEKGIIREY